jgi:hypothetical protein
MHSVVHPHELWQLCFLWLIRSCKGHSCTPPLQVPAKIKIIVSKISGSIKPQVLCWLLGSQTRNIWWCWTSYCLLWIQFAEIYLASHLPCTYIIPHSYWHCTMAMTWGFSSLHIHIEVNSCCTIWLFKLMHNHYFMYINSVSLVVLNTHLVTRVSMICEIWSLTMPQYLNFSSIRTFLLDCQFLTSLDTCNIVCTHSCGYITFSLWMLFQ